jgi:hypothetical protein
VEHKHTPGQFSRPFVFDGPSIGIVATCVYVSLEQPLYMGFGWIIGFLNAYKS